MSTEKVLNLMKIKYLISFIFLAGFLLVFLMFTNPKDVPLPFILVPFVFFGVVVFLLVRVLLNIFLSGDEKYAKKNLYGAILAVIIVNFALLRSIGQLTFRDGVISVLFTIVVVIYISKLRIKT